MPLAQIADFLLKLVAVWQFDLLVLGVAALAILRRPLTSLIGRVKKTKWFDVEEDTSTSVQIQQPKKKDRQQEAVQQLLQLGTSPALVERENLIRQDLQQRGVPEPDRIRVLIHHLAATQLALYCEEVYNSIFGSQIFLLKRLNTTRAAGYTTHELTQHFDRVKEMFPKPLADWSQQKYLTFLFLKGLITDADQKVVITESGIEFLAWLVRTGSTENRPL